MYELILTEYSEIYSKFKTKKSIIGKFKNFSIAQTYMYDSINRKKNYINQKKYSEIETNPEHNRMSIVLDLGAIYKCYDYQIHKINQ